MWGMNFDSPTHPQRPTPNHKGLVTPVPSRLPSSSMFMGVTGTPTSGQQDSVAGVSDVAEDSFSGQMSTTSSGFGQQQQKQEDQGEEDLPPSAAPVLLYSRSTRRALGLTSGESLIPETLDFGKNGKRGEVQKENTARTGRKRSGGRDSELLEESLRSTATRTSSGGGQRRSRAEFNEEEEDEDALLLQEEEKMEDGWGWRSTAPVLRSARKKSRRSFGPEAQEEEEKENLRRRSVIPRRTIFSFSIPFFDWFVTRCCCCCCFFLLCVGLEHGV